ncbi:hypothetical protein K470DRAFT_109904 [Piedraia hortae CBS 480.64]|uniref:Uncharacterized protein n=1 Tax=Piedraia hortae CBS 480.64 TaxID=1314780 RepID=A0A6A7BUY5_9PEZI|nr:hypothetical protein K470DRAFT_109904 [Piedraia hortae CBS 480.64]
MLKTNRGQHELLDSTSRMDTVARTIPLQRSFSGIHMKSARPKHHYLYSILSECNNSQRENPHST